MEFGLATFGDLNPLIESDPWLDAGQRLRDIIEEITLADDVEVDVFGLGEHHRPDFAISAPEVVLANAAAVTSRIRLSSAVTVLSSTDPVRTYQNFATLDLLSGGRAEIWAGRGSFTESFPLFGQNLWDYDELYAEKLELLLNIREHEIVRWSGKHRPAIDGLGIYPRAAQNPLPVWIGSGGTASSAQRAGFLGLPIIIAIIGGNWRRFRSVVDIYRHAASRAVPEGESASTAKVAINSLGFITPDSQDAVKAYFPAVEASMRRIARERAWGRLTEQAFQAQTTIEGAHYVGSPQQIVEKILASHEVFEHDRFVLQLGTGSVPHRDMMRAIELFGTDVIPAVKAALAKGAHIPPSDTIVL